MLGSRVVLEDSFISGKPKFLASEREVDSPRELMGKYSFIQRCIISELVL